MSLAGLTGSPRHGQLLMLIAERGYVNIDELANLLDVSIQTVHRDIRKLSEQGLITYHHGGTGRASSVVNTALEQCKISQTEEKRAIAEAVADHIPGGSTTFITIGTTVEHIVRALPNHNYLRIIADSLCVAHILYHNPRFKAMVPDGTLHSHNSEITGSSATSFVAGFRTDYLMTSVEAIESDGALMELNVNEANVVKTTMAHTGNILLVADHTRYHVSAAVEIDNVAQIAVLFTDKLPPAALELCLQDGQAETILPQEDAWIFVTISLASYLAT